jgi:hypothetical protein
MFLDNLEAHVNEQEAREAQTALVKEGICRTMDEAAHMLADMGEIDSVLHEELLSDKEAERVYG